MLSFPSKVRGKLIRLPLLCSGCCYQESWIEMPLLRRSFYSDEVINKQAFLLFIGLSSLSGICLINKLGVGELFLKEERDELVQQM